MAIKNRGLVQRTAERWTLFIETEFLRGYVFIPLVRNAEVLLTLKENLKGNKDDLNMLNEVPLLKDKVIIMPILDEQVVENLCNVQTTWNDKIREFSFFINDAAVYAAGLVNQVTKSQMELSKPVLLNDNIKFNNFISYFDSVAGSFQKADKDFLLKEENKPLENNVVEPKVGSDIPVINSASSQDDVNQLNDELQQSESKGKVRTRKKEPGFVSYVLLGVMVAVMTLILLYMLL